MDLFISELKRQISAKRFISYILISIILAVLWAWFIIGGATADFMQVGCYKEYKGKAAIEVAAKDRNVTAGKMTEDKFQKGRDAFVNALRSDDESDVEITKDLLQYAVYADSLVMQNIQLKNIRGESINGYAKLPENAGKSFYENEDICYEHMMNLKLKNEAEKELALKMWNEVEKPYTYYGGYEVWSEGAEHIQIFTFILLIIAGFFSSGIVARDRESGLDEIISTTKKGRKNLLCPKLLLPIIMAVLIYTVGMGTYVVILKHYLPADAIQTSVQVFMKTVLPYNLDELMKNMIIFGLVGIITISAFTTFISSISKKTSIAMSIIVLVIISGFILSLMMDASNSIISFINFILPGSVIFSFLNIGVPVVSIFGKAILSFKLSLIISMLLILISLILTSWTYVRRGIKCCFKK
ncbi:ABC transporter permease [Clostridium senegalense]